MMIGEYATMQVAQSQGTCDSPALLRPPSGISREDSPVGILDQPPTSESDDSADLASQVKDLAARLDVVNQRLSRLDAAYDPEAGPMVTLSMADALVVEAATLRWSNFQNANLKSGPIHADTLDRAFTNLGNAISRAKEEAETPVCPTCRGSGRAWVHDAAGGFGTTCSSCDGTGTR
jgi:hypothetical protein